MPRCAALLRPLNSLLAKTKSNVKTLAWNDTAVMAFYNVKEALANATLLVHPEHDAPMCIMTDASDSAYFNSTYKTNGSL